MQYFVQQLGDSEMTKKLKIKEVAELYNVTERTIWNWITTDKLPDGITAEQLPTKRWRLIVPEKLEAVKPELVVETKEVVWIEDIEVTDYFQDKTN
jgi:hypothetical protein